MALYIENGPSLMGVPTTPGHYTQNTKPSVRCTCISIICNKSNSLDDDDLIHLMMMIYDDDEPTWPIIQIRGNPLKYLVAPLGNSWEGRGEEFGARRREGGGVRSTQKCPPLHLCNRMADFDKSRFSLGPQPRKISDISQVNGFILFKIIQNNVSFPFHIS